MDAFENVVAAILQRQGYLTLTSARVDLSKAEKRSICLCGVVSGVVLTSIGRSEDDARAGEFDRRKDNECKEELRMRDTRTMHTVWLVMDVDRLGREGPTREDKLLKLGVTYEEWYSLFFKALGIDKRGYAQAYSDPCKSFIGEFDSVLPEYPLLSRFHGIFSDVTWRHDEFGALEAECKLAADRAVEPEARRAIETLLQMVAQARDAGASLHFEPQS